MARVTTRFVPFTTTPSIFEPATYPEAIDVRNEEMQSRCVQIDTIGQEINDVADEVNTNTQSALASKEAAEDSASEALISEQSALASKEAAELAKQQAEALYDEFDDRYLGAKETPPATDNDGNPLETGAMYFNINTKKLYVYDSLISQWVDTTSVPTLFASLSDIDLSGLLNGDILIYNSSTSKWENKPKDYYTKTEIDNNIYTKTEINTRLNQLFIKPFSKRRLPLFAKASPSSFIIPTGTRIQTDNAFVELVSNTTVSLNTDLLIPESKTAGTDYYVYAKNDGTFYVSSNDSIGTDRLIGGFHYGLTGEAEATSGTKTEADMVKLRGINEYSFWDLKYYANCKAGNKGMFIVDNKCYDIYMGDVNYGIDFYSKANAQIAGGGTDYGRGYPKIPLMFGGNGTTNYGKLTPFVAFDLVNAAGKELISYQEFTKIAYGVQEGLAQPETIAGQTGHIGAVTSKYGMEQAIGTQWIWSSSLGTSSSGTWNNIADARGQVYSDVIVAILGGGRNEAAGGPGSRCSAWSNGLTVSVWHSGFRGCCDLVILD